MKCNVMNIWHPKPQMLDRRYLTCTDFTPVKYDGGEAMFTIMGYITTISPEQCAILFDHSFMISDGSHPAEDTPVLCDAIKDMISSVISKTIAILELELKSRKLDHKLEFVLDDLSEKGHLPQQLIDIQMWSNKKLIVDHNAVVNPDPYNASLYFSEETPLTGMVYFLTRWDEFYSMSTQAIDYLRELVKPNMEPFSDDIRTALLDVKDEIRTLCDSLNDIKMLINVEIMRSDARTFDPNKPITDPRDTPEAFMEEAKGMNDRTQPIENMFIMCPPGFERYDDTTGALHNYFGEDGVADADTTEGALGQDTEGEEAIQEADD